MSQNKLTEIKRILIIEEDDVLPKAEVITACKECGDDFENWLNTDMCDICYDALSNDTDEDEEDDEDDILRCDKCGYEDYKNEDGEWVEVLTHTESDKVFCKSCMPKKIKKRILIIEEDSDDE